MNTRSIPVNYKAAKAKIQKQIESKDHPPYKGVGLPLPGAFGCHTGKGCILRAVYKVHHQ